MRVVHSSTVVGLVLCPCSLILTDCQQQLLISELLLLESILPLGKKAIPNWSCSSFSLCPHSDPNLVLSISFLIASIKFVLAQLFMHWRRKWQPTPSILAWEMPRTEEPDGPQSMGRIKVGLNPATTNRSISKTTIKCVCVCVCVCVYLLLPSWSLSRNLHVFLPLYLLTASRRPVCLAPASPRRSGSG